MKATRRHGARPEYRAFDALVVTPASLAKPEDVSDADARAQYDKDREAKYTAPETRKLQQIVYPNQADAEEAEAKLKSARRSTISPRRAI